MPTHKKPELSHGTSEKDASNLILRSLPPATLARLSLAFELRTIERGDVLARPDRPLEHFYFINCGMVSQVKTMRDGRSVEVAAIGIEGGVDLQGLSGSGVPLLELVVQIKGAAYRIAREALTRIAAEDGQLRRALDKYARFAVGQIAQTAACNGLHSVEQRCCRWLLTAHDNALTDTFPLTHDFLATMLGVQRAGVSIAAGALQRAGYINYRRGTVTISNRDGLENSACECYRSLQDELNGLSPSRRNFADGY